MYLNEASWIQTESSQPATQPGFLRQIFDTTDEITKPLTVLSY